MQSPCSRAAAFSTAPAVTSTVASGPQWTCTEASAATIVRAVSPERLDSPSSFALGDVSSGTTTLPSRAVPFDALLRAPSPLGSAVLDHLRPVVLQI